MPRKDNITVDEYERLYAAYLESRSISEASRKAGVTYVTAEKYIKRGTEQFRAIRDRVANLANRIAGEVDDRRVLEVRAHRAIHGRFLTQLAEAVRDVILAVDGPRDEQGRISVDEGQFRDLIRAQMDVQGVGERIRIMAGEAEPAVLQTVQQVNVGVQVLAGSPARQRAHEFLVRHGALLSELAKNNGGKGVLAAVAAVASTRTGTSAPIEPSDDDGDGRHAG